MFGDVSSEVNLPLDKVKPNKLKKYSLYLLRLSCCQGR